jgi:hypothetical protein
LGVSIEIPVAQRDEVKDVDWAYLAGIIDGEGTITIVKTKQYRTGRALRYKLLLLVTNTDWGLIEFLTQRFAGAYVDSVNRAENRKVCYTWRVTKRDTVKWLLKGCLPYLRIKQRQAILLLNWIDSRERQPNARAPYNETEHVLFKEIWAANHS